MTPLHVLIVDDEPPARQRMRELLDDCSAEIPQALVAEAANGLEGIRYISEHAADVALVDIHMPGMSGIEFARHVQLAEPPPAVIFVTAHDEYAVQAFELNAVDYLLKPVRADRLVAALRKAAAGARISRDALANVDPRPRRFLSVVERGRVTLVPVADALYLKAELKYVTLRTRDREYLIEESLLQLEHEFPGVFVRIHRNCLVARGAIRGFERASGEASESGWLLLLEGCGEKLPVSRRQWTQVKAAAQK